MKDPDRLLDESMGFERSLLRAGAADTPPRGAEARAALALGLGATMVTATAAKTVGAAAAKNAPGAVTAMATKSAWVGLGAVLVKAVGVGVVAGVVAAGVVPTDPTARVAQPNAPSTHVASTAAPPRVESSRASSPSAALDPPVAPPILAAAATTLSAGPPARPSVRETVTARAVETRAVPHDEPRAIVPALSKAPAPPPSIADEIALLDRARAALGAGDAASALALVDDHDTRFPHPSFDLESTVLRIDALDLLGRHHAALSAADAFLVAHPNTSMSKHVRSVAERLRNGTTNL